jgi:hypothetical protein
MAVRTDMRAKDIMRKKDWGELIAMDEGKGR